MTHHHMDNGENFMRRYARIYGAQRVQNMAEAQQQAQQQAINQYNQSAYNAYRQAAQQAHPWTPGEKPEPEDLTGLRLLEEFLAKRKRNQGE